MAVPEDSQCRNTGYTALAFWQVAYQILLKFQQYFAWKEAVV